MRQRRSPDDDCRARDDLYDGMVSEMERSLTALRERYSEEDVDRFMEMLEFLTSRYNGPRDG